MKENILSNENFFPSKSNNDIDNKNKMDLQVYLRRNVFYIKKIKKITYFPMMKICLILK